MRVELQTIYQCPFCVAEESDSSEQSSDEEDEKI
jgi:hypothetical protein